MVWQYDKCGRITQEHQGFSSQYFDYDPAGRLFRTRMPDGNILTYHYQGENVSQIDLNGQTLSSHQWEHGQEIRRHMGRFGELTCRHQFDERGRLRQQTLQLHQTLSKPIERRYDYNVVNELTQITDNYKGIKTFTYDLKSRIATASHKPYTGLTLSDKPGYDDVNGYRGYDEQFRFDGADNLLSHDMPLDSLKQFEVSHAKTSRQDDSPTPQDKAQHVEGQPAVKAIHANRLMLWADRHYQYDEFGNLIRERRGKRQHTEHCFTWDGQHRLIEFKKIRHYHDAHDPQFHETVVSSYRYTYDALGRRISKTDMQTGDKTLFFWLGDKLLTECHADDANFHPSVVNNERDKANNYRCRSYVYTPDGHGFSPLAQINGRGRGGEIYYYFNDHLGTPQELVTAQGEIVWSAVYKSYGNLAIDYQTVPQPLRLPGQYFDEESGLHYNRYRYYDPHCARYISQDPIGLAGGENAYSYVANPISRIDPLGLNEVCPGTEAGKGTTNLQQLAKTEMDNLATLYNNKNVHPKDFTISVNGKTLVTDKSVSAGAPVFKGASDSDVMTYFKLLSGVDTMPTAKIISGKGTVYSVKVTEGPNAGSNITLRSFSDSATQTKAKWTIDIKNPGINKGNRVEMKFQ